MRNNLDLDPYEQLMQIPEDETKRQYYYMAQCRKKVRELTKQLGHVPTCCVTTFGCPTV